MKLTLNLASRRYINERALTLACLVLTLLLLLLLIFQLRGWMQSREEVLVHQAEINKLEERLQGKVPQRLSAEDIALQQQEFSVAQQLLQQDAFRWTELFDRMEKLLPENVSIRSFSPDYNKGSLTIVGVAKNLIDLQDLLDNLHNESFKSVYLRNQNQVEVLDYQEQKRPALSFSILLEGVFNDAE